MSKRPRTGGPPAPALAHGDRIERVALRLSRLEAARDAKRSELQALFGQMQSIRSRMTEMESELQAMDGTIEEVEEEGRRLAKGGCGAGLSDKYRGPGPAESLQYRATQLSPTQLSTTQPPAPGRDDGRGGGWGGSFVGHTQDVGTQDYGEEKKKEEISDGGGFEDPRGAALTMNPDEILTEPVPEDDGGPGEGRLAHDAEGFDIANHYDNEGDLDQDDGPPLPPEDMGGAREEAPPAAPTPGAPVYRAAPAAAGTVPTTIGHYFGRTGGGTGTEGGVLARVTNAAATAATTTTTSSSSSVGRRADYMRHLASDGFPWSAEMARHLRDTFRIPAFRDNQKEIINCTMGGRDAFVIMRTGGGKSLTYQLPAVLEGRGSRRRVTLVVSPLISLIQDQEEQMNAFVPGSAVSFVSGIGTAEHAQRWAQVRDPNGGVCLILVTPEKVYKSNKLKSELEKLNDAGRLGRFVIDEAHCASHDGHTYRPDYTKLGFLKSHFPGVPLVAVTATASDRVKDDCARILRLGANYDLFRSTADRPNLNYSVRSKPDGAQKCVDDMIEFIRSKHRHNAGIIYTFSRREAEDVAKKLCKGGIIARPYHSEVRKDKKQMTHRSWMRNETQVVVATIAFGLGINKPDVRFVLHHSLSKSLEGYYQESGRAGRDGQPADCVLYYSPKDNYRTIGMIHGEHGEGGFFNMMRYAQANGNGDLCRSIILNFLGEPDAPDISSAMREGCDRTELREVGRHAKVAAKLLWETCQSNEDLTPAQLVTQWRAKNAPDYVKAYPPGNDLNKEECDRVIVSMMIEGVFEPKVIYNSYGSNVYLQLTSKGQRLIGSVNPEMKMQLPKRKAKEAKQSKSSLRAAAARPSSTSSSESAAGDGWISTKTSKKKKRNKKASTSKKRRRPSKSSAAENDVIILSSSDDEDENTKGGNKKRPPRAAKLASKRKSKKDLDLFDDDISDTEFFFLRNST